MPDQFYRIIEHTADTGFEVQGESKEELFETAAKAFFDIMWEVGQVRESETSPIEIHGGDLKELVVNFLEEFLYLFDAKELICTKIKVESVTDTNIISKAWLQEFDKEYDHELLGVKAVTYHQLFIGQKADRWIAQIFLDI